MRSTHRERANAVRFLSIDAIQKAESGHPGMPLGMADIAEVLWHDFMRHHPSNPSWLNRDRFVLSNGHGSMLQYALLHLTGYDLSIEDIKQFRQLHSKTPGHPEWGVTPGVETTTGPLGQGLGNAVGMAIAEKHLAHVFNRPNFNLIDYYTYCFVGDGCLMEGISHEVSSLAGTLGLNKLIVFYDDNGISIDGEVRGWYRDNTAKRFDAYGWHVIPRVDGHRRDAIKRAISLAHAEKKRPTLICCQTTIGWGSPNFAGTAKSHGAPLGEKEIAKMREQLAWHHPPFVIPAEIYADWSAKDKGLTLETAWRNLFTAYREKYPELAQSLIRRLSKDLPPDWSTLTSTFVKETQLKKQTLATRKASQQCLDFFTTHLPEMMGGSADLTESNCTNWQGMALLTEKNPQGRYIHFGVREFGMAAIMNGIALSQAILPFAGTFLIFSDYARNAIRLSALMQQRVIYVLTHDSIGLGEDGPTHQPVEQLPSLRLIPNLMIWRPCDAVETAVAWQLAIESRGPTCLLLSRQNLKHQERTDSQLAFIGKGGYILYDVPKNHCISAIIIATGSEVEIAMEAAKQLAIDNIWARVVSMPSTSLFLQQSEAYQAHVLPEAIEARVIVEAAATEGWSKFMGKRGKVMGLNDFGASAPAKDLFKAYELTVQKIVAVTKTVIENIQLGEKI